MSNLNIVTPPDSQQPQKKSIEGSSLQERKIERRAYYEKAWKEYPQQFDYLRTSIGRNRFIRFQKLAQKSVILNEGRAADLGCGAGNYAKWLCKQGMRVDAVDIASIPLEILKKESCNQLNLIQDYIPYTKLDDDCYDLVICIDIIAELHPTEYRMLMSELARLIKPSGHVICSTPLDLHSEDALERFAELVDTEFEILDQSFAYDRLYIKLIDFFAWPRRVVRASKTPTYKKEALENRNGFSRWFFSVASTSVLTFLWKGISWITNPISHLIENSDFLRSALQSMTNFIWQENGITHVIFLTKRRSLLNLDTRETPHDVVLPKGKRTVWE